jgi:hypothetical protein
MLPSRSVIAQRALWRSEQAPAVLTAAHPELQRAAPAVIVLEDLHWADEATLDVIKYLARRPSAAELLIVLTFRDDELAPHHPLRSLLAFWRRAVWYAGYLSGLCRSRLYES